MEINISQQNYLKSPSQINIPEEGDIPVEVCVSSQFPYTLDNSLSYVEWRLVTPTSSNLIMVKRMRTADWSKAYFMVEEGASCSTSDGDNGTVLVSMLPVADDVTGQLHYKATLGTLSGGLYQYPTDGLYNILEISYRSHMARRWNVILVHCCSRFNLGWSRLLYA